MMMRNAIGKKYNTQSINYVCINLVHRKPWYWLDDFPLQYVIDANSDLAVEFQKHGEVVSNSHFHNSTVFVVDRQVWLFAIVRLIH